MTFTWKDADFHMKVSVDFFSLWDKKSCICHGQFMSWKSHALFMDNKSHAKVMPYHSRHQNSSCLSSQMSRISPKKSGQNMNFPWLYHHSTHELWEKSRLSHTKVMPILQWILYEFHMTSCWSGSHSVLKDRVVQYSTVQ